MIGSFEQAEIYLSGLYGRAEKTTGDDQSLSRMWPLLERAGNPQEKLKIIHVAGTSGKTSTSYFISAMLVESGLLVGLSVSPHIISLGERLQIGGSPLSESEFCRLLSRFTEVLGEDHGLSYFEYMTVFELWAFVELDVDYAVLEVGLGGLHDATNVCRRPDKVCVITDIGFDHQNILGDSISEIAAQKAGIIQQNNEVFCYRQQEKIDQQIIYRASEKLATLHYVEPKTQQSKLAAYQQRNWQLAQAVFKFIVTRDDLRSLSDTQMIESQVSVPGRINIFEDQGKTIVVDGAHNQQKAQAFISSFKQLYPDQKAVVLLAMKQGKDYEDVLMQLSEIANSFIFTSFNVEQDFPIKSIDPATLQKYAESLGVDSVYESNLVRAYSLLISSPAQLCVITGSLYLVSEVLRSNLLNNKRVKS